MHSLTIGSLVSSFFLPSPPQILYSPPTLFTLSKTSAPLMSDIEKHEIPQRRCQVGNPAPLYVSMVSSLDAVDGAHPSPVEACLLLRRRRSSSLFTTRKHATLPFPMSLSAWHSSTVDSPSSLLACGSSSRVILLVQLVSFKVLHYPRSFRGSHVVLLRSCSTSIPRGPG